MRHARLFLGLLVLAALLGAASREGALVEGRTLHVAVTGSDANPGTLLQPFLTIQKAVDVSLPGDVILVHAGMYPEVVQIRDSGLPGARITLTNAGDGGVVVNPVLAPRSCSESSPARDRAIQLRNGADYWSVSGLTIVGGVLVTGGNVTNITDELVRDRTLPGRGTYDPAAAEGLLESIGVNAADHVEILDNEITGRGIFTVAARFGLISGNEIHHVDCGTGAGIWINSFSDFWTIRGNHVHDIPESDEHYMSEGIRQGRGSAYNLVESNLVEDLGGEGRGVTVDAYASWNVMRGNTVRRADQGFNEQSAGWGNQWIGNLSESNRRYGLNVDGKDGQLTEPDDGVPAQTVVRCTVAGGNGKHDLNIGAVQQATFTTNAFGTVWVSPRAESYWTLVGNTWDGGSSPPPRNPPEISCDGPPPPAPPSPPPPPPPSELTLSARGYKVRGQIMVDLAWSGATTASVDVWRNGVNVLVVANDGFETDATGTNGNGSFTYRVCEAGTSICSNFANASS